MTISTFSSARRELVDKGDSRMESREANGYAAAADANGRTAELASSCDGSKNDKHHGWLLSLSLRSDREVGFSGRSEAAAASPCSG